MNKFSKVAIVLAVASAAGSAFAQSGTIDNWRSGLGDLVWKNGTNEYCWRDAFWTPATAAPGCDGSTPIAPKAAPNPAPAVEQPKAAPTPPPPPQQAQPQKVTYAADALFDFDKAVLKPEGKAKLDDLAAQIKGINLEVVVATGHTDSIGTVAYNQKLSVRRAEAVKAYLVAKGIDSNRIYTEGKGKSQPVADNHTKEGRAKNRRVVIEVVGTK